MDKERILNDLQKIEEMNPDKHDGSYELLREIVKSYSTLEDYSKITYLDMDAVYLAVIGTWTVNSEKKKEKIELTCLPVEEKKRLKTLIDEIWNRACLNGYENHENGKISYGMFGTGFRTFKNKISDDDARKVINLLVDISEVDDINEMTMLNKAEDVFYKGIKSLGAASASVMLHCLKPNVFPIINGNMGAKSSLYVALGIAVEKPSNIETYIANSKRIKEFRDNNLPFKNYRILDIFARKLSVYETDDFYPSLDEYDTGITTQKFVELLQNEEVVKKQSLDTVYLIYKIGGEATCTQLEKKYGNSYSHYNMNATITSEAIQKATNCPFCPNKENEKWYWAILFQGRYTKNDEEGAFVWRLRTELSDAIAQLEEAGFFEGFIVEKTVFDHNTILYGPPGTGKTYNSARYAVAICDELSLKEVNSWKYEDVLKRYNELKEANRIAFTTFHQSYGYEEFIEGIRPNVDEDNAEGLTYRREDGIFKKFCDEAGRPMIKNVGADFGFNNNPVVWKVSLKGTGDNEVRTECLENGHIRIGWDEYGENITDDIEYTSGGKVVLDSFYNKMRIGDIVVSCYSSETTDAIGVITGEPEWSEQYDYYRRIRKVKWLIKGKNENITSYNNNKAMTLSSVYKLSMSVRNVIDIISKYTTNLVEEENNKKYVFIIDEINRGNISKIFGELITLIENTKREGMKEAASATLPYSGESFSVPSNVYILGTMNTADRSIALMDTALRRRFSFIEMMPDPSVLTGIEVKDNGESVDIAKLLEVINQRIECLFDREHTIGHAFFTKLRENRSVEVLGTIFKKSVVPLLQEYFYEDYEKIRLVLGDNGKKDESIEFVTKKEFDTKIFRSGNVEDLPDDKPIYHINNDAFDNILSYKGIF